MLTGAEVASVTGDTGSNGLTITSSSLSAIPPADAMKSSFLGMAIEITGYL